VFVDTSILSRYCSVYDGLSYAVQSELAPPTPYGVVIWGPAGSVDADLPLFRSVAWRGWSRVLEAPS
jgi:hypothetical protein